ncbi:hypothetical protein [Natronobacterium texcoconense]|uniref:DUF5658 domain-containing protein n=1 Tax=Natronobacterium texcoconense TaxID=1095778 RepID=A0A1H0ZEW7_NATTX|nr:hypothetical protein [Natronobacterium texcoconense]SDQ25849.1 hypothetical protein SAMN04489842_0252 [Natronobacterium texcoconense]
MNWSKTTGMATVDWALALPSVHHSLWILAVLTYGIGDLASTLYFVSTAPVVEAHPIAAHVTASVGHGILVPWKMAAFLLFYGLYRITPSDYRIGVPIGLVLLGGAVTAWNVYLSVVLVE